MIVELYLVAMIDFKCVSLEADLDSICNSCIEIEDKQVKVANPE